MIYKKDFYISVGFILSAELLFASMAAAIKLTSVYLPNESIVFFRNLLVVLILLPWIMYQGLDKMSTRQFRLHLLRSLAGLGAMYCFFYTLIHLPLAEAILLKTTLPFFIPIISLLWLGETVQSLVYWAILIGFIGITVILKPGMETFSPVALIALMSGLLAALARSTIRRMSETEPSMRVVFYFALISTLISAVPMSWAWVTPNGSTWGLLLIIAVLGIGAQLLMTQAYMRATSSAQLGPFSYTSVIFATLYGWLFWNEQIDLWFLIGTVLIIIAGFLITQSHRANNTLHPNHLMMKK